MSKSEEDLIIGLMASALFATSDCAKREGSPASTKRERKAWKKLFIFVFDRKPTEEELQTIVGS